MSDRLWQFAVASYCLSRGHEPRMENISYCRFTVMSGVGKAKPGHQQCEPLMTVEGIREFLNLDPQMVAGESL